MYQANAKRAQLQQSYANYTEYLLGLEMIAEIQDFTPVALPASSSSPTRATSST